jgi:CIC family chloride channel protein
MGPPVTVTVDNDLHVALERLLEAGVRSLPVLSDSGTVMGILDETDIIRAYHLDITQRRRDSSAEVIAPPT